MPEYASWMRKNQRARYPLFGTIGGLSLHNPIRMKYVLIALVLGILGIGAYVVLGGPSAGPAQPSQETGTTGGTASTPDTTQVPVGAMATVTYSDAGFSPKIVTLRVGDTVHFVNSSSNDLWVASNEHPTHTEFDGTTKDEHCPNGASLDQCARSAPGTSWDYTFTKAGTFGYHNHAESDHTGTVIVE